MKKTFVEPAMHRIELNLRENIATSTQIAMGYYFTTSLFSCTIVTTGKGFFTEPRITEEEAAVCLTTKNNARGVWQFYPREVVLPYFRR